MLIISELFWLSIYLLTFIQVMDPLTWFLIMPNVYFVVDALLLRVCVMLCFFKEYSFVLTRDNLPAAQFYLTKARF